MKKLFSILIIVCILTSICSVTASAVTEPETTAAETAVAAPNLSIEEIDNPELSLIEPDQPITIIPGIDIPEIGTGTTTFEEYTPYVGFSSNEYAQSYEGLSNISYGFTLYNYEEYDYIVVSYATTTNITLNDYTDDIIYYSESEEGIPFSLDFSATSIADINLDAHSIDFEKIVFDYKVYYKDTLVQSDSETVYVLPTLHGSYASAFGSIYAYSAYIRNLLDAELITAAEHKKASKRMTEAQEIPNGSNMTKAELNAYRDSILNRTYDMKYYDVSSGKVETALNNTWREAKQLSLSQISVTEQVESLNTEASVSSTNSTNSGTTGTNIIEDFQDTIVAIDYSVAVSPSGSFIVINGAIEWRDVHGNFHPARNLQVQIMDENALLDTVINTIYTDEYGEFYTTFDNNLNSLENGYDIYIRMNFYNDHFNINDGTSGIFSSTIFANGYYLDTPLQSNVKASVDPVRYEALDSTCVTQNKVAYIHQALIVGYYYYDAMESDAVESSSVIYPCKCDDMNVSHANSSRLCIKEKDYFRWDTIIHELGHKVSFDIEINSDDSGDHSLKENLAATYGKEKGIGIAWAEGWATYFSLAAQEYYNYDIAGIPWVADDQYSSLVNKLDIDGSYKYTYVKVYSYCENSGFGEANEASVTGVLLDFLNPNSNLGFTDQSLWNLFKSSKAQTFSEFMEYVYAYSGVIDFSDATFDITRINTIGTILENRNIAAKPIRTTGVFSALASPEFEYNGINLAEESDENNNNTHDYSAHVVIFDESGCLMSLTLQCNDATENSSIAFSNVSQWESILNSFDSCIFYWGIATFGDDSPSTGVYISHLEKGFIEERTTIITDLNVLYASSLEPGEDKWFSFSSELGGNYCVSLDFANGSDETVELYTSTNLLAKDVLDDQDIGNEKHFFWDGFLESQEAAYIRVTNTSNDEMNFNVSIFEIESVFDIDINGTDERWGCISVNRSGTYLLFSLGDIDTYGELFRYPVASGSISNRIACDDNYGEGNNFAMTYYMQKDEVFYLRIRGKTANDSGNVTCLNEEVPNLNHENFALERDLSEGEFSMITFNAQTTGKHVFYTQGDMDSYMYILEDPIFYLDEIPSNALCDDDSGDGTNAMIYMDLEEGQRVYVVIHEYYMSDGEFELCVANNMKIISPLPATYQEEFYGIGDYIVYAFTPSAASTYTFSTSGYVDTYIEVFDYPVRSRIANENVIAENDDVDEYDYNASVTLSLAKNQTVYIKVRGYSSGEMGEFNFVVEDMYGASEIVVMDASADYYESDIIDGRITWFAFTATEAGTYAFTTGPGVEVDTYGELYNGYAPMNPTAVLLASDDDGCMTEDDQSNYNFWIEHTLAAGETVYLKVGAYEDNSFEDYYYLYLFKVG